jgi:ribonuclease D
MSLTWLETKKELAGWLGETRDEALAVDTESDHGYDSHARVCLIQLGVDGEVALLDPFEWTGPELAPLWDVLADADRRKIFHAGYNDLEEMDRDWGIDIRNVFDTRTAVRFLDTRRSGLDWLLDEWLGVDLPPDLGRFDWSRRPLPVTAIEYAAADVRHLHDLRDQLRGCLRDAGWWEAFCEQSEHFARSAVSDPETLDPEGWREIDCGPNLDGEGRRALRELYAWRRELALEQNRPVEAILNDEGLTHLASHRPTTPEELKRVSPVSDDVMEARGSEILETVRRAESREIPPRTERNRPKHLDAEVERRYDALREWRNATTEELNLPPAFVASNDTLQSIARRRPETADDLRDFDEVLDWQIERWGEVILRIVEDTSEERQ